MSNNIVGAAAIGLPNRRRAIFGAVALAAVPLSTVPALAAITTSSPDPVYAAIEQHRIAAKAYYAVLAKTRHIVRIPDDLIREGTIRCRAETEARLNLHQAVPTTFAGLKAYVAYWQECLAIDKYTAEEIGWEAIDTIAEALERMWAHV